MYTRSGKVLVGYRKNEPAKDTWFVPGGRIYKNEPFPVALTRILKDELGIHSYSGDYSITGVSDHIYDTCFYKADPSCTNTHYVVITVKLKIDCSMINETKMMDQHTECKWMTTAELLQNKEVHEYTRRHFHTNLLQGKVCIREHGISIKHIAKCCIHGICRFYGMLSRIMI
jgi:colanic acid biosynthesis protein WcaH